jgi:hypothetical protein
MWENASFGRVLVQSGMSGWRCGAPLRGPTDDVTSNRCCRAGMGMGEPTPKGVRDRRHEGGVGGFLSGHGTEIYGYIINTMGPYKHRGDQHKSTMHSVPYSNEQLIHNISQVDSMRHHPSVVSHMVLHGG